MIRNVKQSHSHIQTHTLTVATQPVHQITYTLHTNTSKAIDFE